MPDTAGASKGSADDALASAERFGHHLAPPEAAPGADGSRESVAPLPAALQADLERISGQPLGDVRVHYDSAEPDRLDALAYAQGREIHLAPGQEAHLPHEAWHVVQQKRGRVRPTLHFGEARINDDAGLEREADTMGRLASRQLFRPEARSHGGQPAGSGAPPAASAEAGIAQRQLRGAHAEASRALLPAPVPAGGVRGQVVQRVLTGKHAKAAEKIAAYMPDSHEERSAILHEAQDLGYGAPKLPGHMSKSSGKDDKGEAERQRQINAAWDTWHRGFLAHKARQGSKAEEPEEEEHKEKPAPKVAYTPSNKDVRKKKSAQKKKDIYQEYAATTPKPTVKGFAQWKKDNGYT